jgi:signal transduction histidine kinase
MDINFRILILEDNHFDAQLTLRELKKSDLPFVSIEADNKKDYVNAITEFKPNVILSDHSLPTIYSSEALSIAKELCSDAIFILITGTVSEEFAVKIMKEGADDYLLKSSLTRLPAAIINAYNKRKAEKEREENFIKLQEANQELKTFIYRASHDLRGPVSSLRGLINITKEKIQDKGTVSLIEMMDKSANRLDNILLELINTVRAKDQNVEATNIDLVSLINVIIEQHRFLSNFKKIKFHISSDGIPLLYSDKTLVNSILHNVIENAINYHNYTASNCFIDINISGDHNGKNIVVRDNGLGIQKDLIQNVFEMFYRANLVSDGTGLGLYLVKIAVEKLKGRISIESEEKLGTTVKIFIPSALELNEKNDPRLLRKDNTVH